MKTYLYLTKRDLKGVDLLFAFDNAESISATKIKDFSIMGFDRRTVSKIKEVIGERKLTHDVWVESCDSTNDLLSRLRLRGFRKLPLLLQPSADIGKISGSLKQKPTMLRANKDRTK